MQMKGARKTKRGVCAGGKGASKSTFAANCQQRAECSRAPCPLPWLVWQEGGGGGKVGREEGRGMSMGNKGQERTLEPQCVKSSSGK